MLARRRVGATGGAAYDGRMLDANRQPDWSRLSRRETQVLDLVATGLTNVEVAERLGVGVHAVKFHLASIYRKLGAHNRTEATSVYLREAAVREAESSA
jgi:DNA-binding CsgD family transcriptional regulator